MLTKVSPSSFAVFGYEADDLLARNYRCLIDKSDMENVSNYLTEIKNEQANAPFECKALKRDGTPINILWSVHWSAEEKSFFCVAHDITERKRAENLLREAEARIRLIIASMPIGLVIIDSQGKIELTNPSISKMFGYDLESLQHKHLSMLLPKADTVTNEEFTLQLLEKTKMHPLEISAMTASKADLPIEITVNSFETLEGIRYLVLLTDVTERHEIERLKQQFISMVSHELRSPLNSVLGFLEMLPEGVYGDLNENGIDRVGVAQRNINRLMRLINDLLDMDKLESGMLSLQFSKVDLHTTITRSIESVRTLAELSNVRIEEETNSILVTADGDRILQVVINFLSNAIKFSPPGGVIHVSSALQEEFVEVKVKDQGIGIPEEYRARIFEKFQQVRESDWKQKGGTGLGLSISKAIIEQHHGSIGVESEQGNGSTFWFKIPKDQTATNQTAPENLIISTG